MNNNASSAHASSSHSGGHHVLQMPQGQPSTKTLNLAKHAYQGQHSLTTKNSVSRVDVVRAKSRGRSDASLPDVDSQLYNVKSNQPITANTSQVMQSSYSSNALISGNLGKSTSRAVLKAVSQQKSNSSKHQKGQQRSNNQTPLHQNSQQVNQHQFQNLAASQSTNLGQKALKFANAGSLHGSTSALHATFGQPGNAKVTAAIYNNMSQQQSKMLLNPSNVSASNVSGSTQINPKGLAATANNPMMKRIAKRATNIQAQVKQQQFQQSVPQVTKNANVQILTSMGSPQASQSQHCSPLIHDANYRSVKSSASALQIHTQHQYPSAQPKAVYHPAQQQITPQHNHNSSGTSLDYQSKSSTQNLGVRISQILRNSQKSPQGSDRDVVKFYDQLDQLFEAQKHQALLKKQAGVDGLQLDANMLFRDQTALGTRSTKNQTAKIGEAVLKAMADSVPQSVKHSQNLKSGKSRTSKKSLHTQLSRSNKSHSTKDNLNSQHGKRQQQQNAAVKANPRRPSQPNSSAKQGAANLDDEQMIVHSDLLDEILSRNGVEDSSGPIDLRIAAASPPQAQQAAELDRGRILPQQPVRRRRTSNAASSAKKQAQDDGGNSQLSLRQPQNSNSNQAKQALEQELQYARQQQSKSQCKGVASNSSGLKKSFSIALLKAGQSGAMSSLAGEAHSNEYNNASGQPVEQPNQQQQPQKGPFGMYYSRQNSQQEYSAASSHGAHHAPSHMHHHSHQLSLAKQKRSDSSNSASSLGDVSVNSVQQQAVKANSHYGALKHLASNNIAADPRAQPKDRTAKNMVIVSSGKTSNQPSVVLGSKSNSSALFTRNNPTSGGTAITSQSMKKLTSFDENVCVNQIRETGLVHQKFANKQSPQEIQTRFSARKNYGSVCIQPASSKNKPLFFSVCDGKGIDQPVVTSQNGGENCSRLSSLEDQQQRRYNVFSKQQMLAVAEQHLQRASQSYQNSPKNSSIKYSSTVSIGGGNQCNVQMSSTTKSPFLSKESRKGHLIIKDGHGGSGSKSSNQKPHNYSTSQAQKRSSKALNRDDNNSNTAATTIKQSKLWLAEGHASTVSDSKKSHQSQQHEKGGQQQLSHGKKTSSVNQQSVRLKSPAVQAGQHVHQQQARTTKQSPFMARNSNPVIPASQHAQLTNAQNNNDSGQKGRSKQHKHNKSRELHGSGVVNQMNLNSSLNQKSSQLKQENVFATKRKSHGVQTRVISSGTMKRRSSGSNLVGQSDHNSTQPLDMKKLRKIASISPPKVQQAILRHHQKQQQKYGAKDGPQEQQYENELIDVAQQLIDDACEGNEDDDDQQQLLDGDNDPNSENFVEKIVDLLEKRNLINTQDDESNKPKVNQILTSMLKAHLKSGDGSVVASNASSTSRHQLASSSAAQQQPQQFETTGGGAGSQTDYKELTASQNSTKNNNYSGVKKLESIPQHQLQPQIRHHRKTMPSQRQKTSNLSSGRGEDGAAAQSRAGPSVNIAGVKSISGHKAESSEPSTVYLGTMPGGAGATAPNQQQVKLSKSSSNSTRRNHGQRSDSHYKSNQPTQRKSSKSIKLSPNKSETNSADIKGQQTPQSYNPTPAFKYPSQKPSTKQGSRANSCDEKQEVEEQQPLQVENGSLHHTNLVCQESSTSNLGCNLNNQGEMTSPDELYYVNNNNSSGQPPQKLSHPQVMQNQLSASSSERSNASIGGGATHAGAQVAAFVARRRSTDSSQESSNMHNASSHLDHHRASKLSSQESPKWHQKQLVGSRIAGGNPTLQQQQPTYNYVSANSRSSGSPSDQLSSKKTPYYTGGIGSKRGSQDNGKRIEGKNAYYTNNASGLINPVSRDQMKDSTRFSSNERQLDRDVLRRHSHGSSNNKDSTLQRRRETLPAKQYSSSQKSLVMRASHSQGRLRSQASEASTNNQHHSMTAQQTTNQKMPQIEASEQVMEESKENEECDDSRSPQRHGQRHAREQRSQVELNDCEEDENEEESESHDENESLIIAIRKHYMSQKKRNTHFPSTLRCYHVKAIVGKGAFGKVALAIHRLTRKPVAIKMIDKTTLQPGQIEKVRCEVALMSAIRHKHIIRLLEVFESTNHMYMVFEYAAGGDLLQLVKRKRCLTENEARRIFRQVVYGIAHCHCRSVLHRDIKLDNILLDEKNHVKVCDFGISRTIENLNEPVMEQCGTPAYIAPEILYEDGYKGFKSDIWGMGVLLYAMVTGTVPFRAQNMRELKYVISAGQFSFPSQNPRDSHRYSDAIKDLIRSMLIVDTKSRISIPEILAHPWLNPMQDRQSMQQGLNYQQLLSMHALQPFGAGAGQQQNSENHGGGSSRKQNYLAIDNKQSGGVVNQIRVENLFIGHGSDGDSGDSSINARIDGLTLTQTQLNEITIDHATVYINEKAIAKLETFGFPKKLVRSQVQSNVLNHATASYHLLVL